MEGKIEGVKLFIAEDMEGDGRVETGTLRRGEGGGGHDGGQSTGWYPGPFDAATPLSYRVVQLDLMLALGERDVCSRIYLAGSFDLEGSLAVKFKVYEALGEEGHGVDAGGGSVEEAGPGGGVGEAVRAHEGREVGVGESAIYTLLLGPALDLDSREEANRPSLGGDKLLDL